MRAIEVFKNALVKVLSDKGINIPQKMTIEPPKDRKHGDIATNVALVLAKELGKNPREIASNFQKSLMEELPSTRIEIAGAGFLNCTFEPRFWWETLEIIEKNKDSYGVLKQENLPSILLEYVSANPTGPLHIGHGRGAAVGDSLCRILKNAGHEVYTEYYINDAGNQMRKLGLSIWLRALELKNLNPEFPEDYYKGDYIIDIAKEMLKKNPHLTELESEKGIDLCYEYGKDSISEGIRKDLQEFKVHHDQWFSEKSLVENNEVNQAFDVLKKSGLAYEQDNALWFKSTDFGDDKDRVLIKSDGSLTYFASDIAYHYNKYCRGYDYLIDVLGADHHGYISRIRGSITALGKDGENNFNVVLIQLVNLLRNGQPVAMSTRSGEFETLSDVVKEVGVDATRFSFLSRKSDSPLDFDLELVKQRNLENPVYYVQYAHARIFGLLRRAQEENIEIQAISKELLSHLNTDEDLEILQSLDQFEDTAKLAAKNLAPHAISYYLTDLAGKVHSYYAKHQVLNKDNIEQTNARIILLKNSAQVIKNALNLLGVSAPTTM